MQYTKLLYTLVLCATAQQSLAVKQPDSTVPKQTEAERAQTEFTTLIDKTINQYEQQKIKPTSAQDQQALQLIKKHPSLLTEDNLRKAYSILLQKTALYIIEHMPDHQGKLWEFIHIMQLGDLAIFNVFFSRIPGTNKLVVDGTGLIETLLYAINALNSSPYPFTAKEKQDIRTNQLKMLQALVAAGADINKPIEEAWGTSTRLSLAVQSGDRQIVDYLISVGANVNPPSNEPLIQAIKTENLELVRLLVEKGASVNQPEVFYEQKKTPLFCALEETVKADKANLEIMQYLLDKGADVNAVNKLSERELTTLDAAHMLKRDDIVQLLSKNNPKK